MLADRSIAEVFAGGFPRFYPLVPSIFLFLCNWYIRMFTRGLVAASSNAFTSSVFWQVQEGDV